jgi:hypothetical protein
MCTLIHIRFRLREKKITKQKEKQKRSAQLGGMKIGRKETVVGQKKKKIASA